MANPGKITELIDEGALANWERFVASLDKAQTDMAKAADTAATLNKNIAKSKTTTDLEKNTTEAEKALADLAKKRAAAALAEERLLQAQMRTADMVARKLKKQAEDEAKLEATKLAAKRATAQFEANAAKDKLNALENEYDANMRLAVNENDLAKARAANSSTAISDLKAQTAATDELTAATAEQNAETGKSSDILTRISGSFSELVGYNLNLKSELKAVQLEMKELANKGGEASAELVQREIELKTALQQASLELRRAAKEQNFAEDSSDQLSVRLDRLRAAWRGLSESERENTDVGKELEKQINALDKELKILDARVGVHNRKVGQYENATKDLTNALTQQFPVLSRLKTEYEGVTNIAKASIKVLVQFAAGANTSAAATTNWSKALKILRIALISTGIGAILVILGSLIAYLTTTAEGIDKVTAVTRPLQAIMRALLGVLQSVGKVFLDAFTNPKKALEDLNNFISRYITPNLRGVYEILSGIVTLDYSRIKAGFSGIQATLTTTGQDMSKFFGDAWRTGQQIDKVMKEIADAEINLIKTQGQLNRTIQEQGEIARDISKSENERKRAASEGLKAVNDLADQQIKLQEKRIELLKLENKDTAETKDFLKELAEAEAELDNIRANAAKQRIALTSAFNRATRNQHAEENRAQKEAERQARIQAELTERQYELAAQLLRADEDRANRAAATNKRLADDEREALNVRMDNLLEYLDNKQQAIDLSYAREEAEISKRLAEATKLEELGRKEEADAIRAIVQSQLETLAEDEKQARIDLKREGNEAVLAIAKAGMSDEMRLRQQAIQTETQAAEIALAESYRKREISENTYQLRKFKLSEESSRRLIELEIETVESIIEANKAKGIGVAEEEKKLADLKMRLSKQAADAQIADAERVGQNERDLTSARMELAQELGNFAQTLYERRFAAEEDQIKQQITNIDARLEREKRAVEISTLTEEEKAARIKTIEARAAADREQLEEKQREVQRRQARAQKAFAIAQATMNTALAVSRAFADYPFPISAVMAGIVGALGAVQIATIAAQPIPRFFKGTPSSPEGLAHVGERGAEIIRYPDGSEALTPNTDTLTWLPRGSEVLTNEETKRYLAKQAMGDVGGRSFSSSVDIRPLVKQQAITNEQLKKMQKNSGRGTILTRGGLVNIHKSGSKWANYLKRNKL